MRVLCGTSGFAYRAWKGAFYPADLPQRRMLAYFASRLDAVEANATFRRMPTPEMLAGWRMQVPPMFVFALKAPQRITHVQRLTGVEGAVAALQRAGAELGPTLGAVLYQLPPSFRKDLPRLRDFLALLPPGAATAFEFRHESWFAEDVFSVLADAGAALCIAQSDDASTPIVPTTRFGYLRLRRTNYDHHQLEEWGREILRQPWTHALVFFKHEDEARGPAFALALRDIVLGSTRTPTGADSPPAT